MVPCTRAVVRRREEGVNGFKTIWEEELILPDDKLGRVRGREVGVPGLLVLLTKPFYG